MTRFSNRGATMIAIAEAFATAAHEAVNQTRKYTGEPYINHPRAVAGMVQAIPSHTWQQVVLALLHDTVEDTSVTLDHIRHEFGQEIRDGLYFLTNVGKEAGNRATRHYLNCERLRQAPGWVATVKVLDIRDNTGNIVDLDPVFAPKYLQEKVDAMRHLTQADPIAWKLTMERIAKAQHVCREKGLAA